MNFILFEKAEENGITWTVDKVKEYCENQELTPTEIKEEKMGDIEFVTAKFEDTTEGQAYRLIEITKTISFIIKDDPSLDEFTVQIPTVEEQLQELVL